MKWLISLPLILFATAALAQSPFGGPLNPLNPLGVGCLTGTFCVWGDTFSLNKPAPIEERREEKKPEASKPKADDRK